MADTGAPWSIPYAEPADLVRDWPELSEDVADAVASALTTAASDASLLTTGTVAKARLPAGTVLQVVDGSILTPVSTTSTADVTTLSITPGTNTSKVLVMASGVIRISTQNTLPALYITDTSNNVLYQGAASGSRSRATWGMTVANLTNAHDFATMSFSIVYLASPATASAYTYKLRVGSSGGSTVRVGTSQANDADSSFTFRVPTTLLAIEVNA